MADYLVNSYCIECIYWYTCMLHFYYISLKVKLDAKDTKYQCRNYKL